ncbi:DUF2341 domain-containing protein [bacterium]|nr:DUF2341 domain-containing protein [bacterium]
MEKTYFENKTIIFVLFILVGLVSLTEAAWLDGWLKRAPVTITGSASGAQTDYQVRVEVPYVSDIQSDFDDIRFTAVNGETLLDYWLDVSTPSVASTFWVEVPSIPVSPATTTIYIYYGNPSVNSISNGDNTFVFFDNFQEIILDTNKWQLATGTDIGKSAPSGDITLSGGMLQLNVYGDGSWARVDSIISFPFGHRWEIKERVVTGNNDNPSIGQSNAYIGGNDSISQYIYWCPPLSINDKKFYAQKDGTSNNYDINFSFSQWYTMAMFSNGIMANYWLDGILEAQETNSTYIPGASESAPFVFRAHSYGPPLTPQIEIDWIILRKYIIPEPVVGAIGGEEEGSSITIFTNSFGMDKAFYNTDENIYITVTDTDENTNTVLQEIVRVTVINNVTNDSETITLIETGNDTGLFRNTNGLPIVTNPGGVSNNNRLEVVGTESINVNYTDDDDGGDFSGDTAGIEMGEKIKVTPYNNVFDPHKGESCQIKIELVEDTHITVKLYTLLGDLVKVLVDEDKQRGTEIIYWDGRNDCGNEVASGTYLLHIEAGRFKDTKKICIIK